MKVLLSPAKSLDFETPLPTERHTAPRFLKDSRAINKEVRKLKPADLSALMDISDALANLNWQRNKSWKTPFTSQNARPAVFAFAGDVYVGMEAYTLGVGQWDELQEKVRILSGLYGLLRPLDLIQPYRLEMGTRLAVGESKDLYHYWRSKLTAALNKELKKKELLVNLASDEYASAIDFKAIKSPVVKVDFKDFKDGKLKIISFFAKKARGLMARYIVDTHAETIDDLKGFDYHGYRFDEGLSKPMHLVFTR